MRRRDEYLVCAHPGGWREQRGRGAWGVGRGTWGVECRGVWGWECARDFQEQMAPHRITGIGYVVVGRRVSTPREELVEKHGGEKAWLVQKTGDD